VSPDGGFVYVGLNYGSGDDLLADESLMVLRRDPSTGALSGFSASAPVRSARARRWGDASAGRGRPYGQPDGRFVEVGGGRIGGTAIESTFARGVDGSLAEVGCFSSSALDGCTTLPSLTHPFRIDDSRDGLHVWIGGDASVVSLVRDASGPLRRFDCITVAAVIPGCEQIGPIGDTIDQFILWPDRTFTYLTSERNPAVSPWGLRIDADGAMHDGGSTTPTVPARCSPVALFSGP
jgi:hypothetical protein